MKQAFASSDINFFRNDTEGCAHVTHLNNAGASLMPFPVTKAIIDHIDLENMIGGYEAADLKSANIKAFYHSASKLLNCRAENIAFTANATDSFSRAISSIVFAPGDVIVTTIEDFISNQITYLALRKRFGINLVRAESLSTGGVDLQSLEKCIIKYKPKLVAVTHIPTNSGLVQPVQEIGIMCKKYDILYLLDACQSAGQFPLDVHQLHCDFLSITCRKFLRGPRGAGFLFVSDRILEGMYEPLFIDMRGADWVSDNEYIQKKDGRRFEDWEFAYALVLGAKESIDYYLQIDASKVEKQIQYLSDYTKTELQKIDGITTHDRGPILSSTTTFHLKESNPELIKNFLLRRRINVVSSPKNYALIDHKIKMVDWVIRVSPHYYNTKEEIDLFIDCMKELSQ